MLNDLKTHTTAHLRGFNTVCTYTISTPWECIENGSTMCIMRQLPNHKQTSLNNKVTARRRLAASEAVWGARMVIAWTERDMNRPLWKKKYFATCSLSHDKLP